MCEGELQSVEFLQRPLKLTQERLLCPRSFSDEANGQSYSVKPVLSWPHTHEVLCPIQSPNYFSSSPISPLPQISARETLAGATAMDGIDAELARAQDERKKLEEALAAGAPMAVSSVTFDKDLYGGGASGPDRFAGYDTRSEERRVGKECRL